MNPFGEENAGDLITYLYYPYSLYLNILITSLKKNISFKLIKFKIIILLYRGDW